MIQVQSLTKRYGEFIAVDDLSFSVNKGDILGFLGPNGAGKSTTMRIITGYMSTTSGKVMIDGIDVFEDPLSAKKKIGYLPEQPPLYNDLNIREYLSFVADIKAIHGKRKKSEIERVSELTGCSSLRKRRIGNLSKGFKQRVGLAQALLGSPPILILDEPTVGLDPSQIIEIRKLIKSLSKEHTVVLSTHILAEVSMLCPKVLIIRQGKKVAFDDLENLTSAEKERGESISLEEAFLKLTTS